MLLTVLDSDLFIMLPAWICLLYVNIIQGFIISILLQCSDIELNPGPIHQKFNKLKICHANGRSLTRAKLKDIEVSSAETFDVFTLSETYLGASVPNDLFEIIRKDKDSLGGGVAAYVRVSILFKCKNRDI